MDFQKKVDYQKKVLLFGRTGAGKSTIANVLVTGGIDNEIFPTGDAARGRTSTIHIGTGRGWTVTDTVGLGEGEAGTISNTDAKTMLTNYLRDIRDSYSHIIFVQKANRFTTVDEMIWLLFANVFKGAEDAFVVLFTGASETWLRDNRSQMPDYFRNRFLLATDVPPLAKQPLTEKWLRGVRERSMAKLQTDLEEHFRERDYVLSTPQIVGMTNSQMEEKAWSLLHFSVEQIQRLFNKVSWLTIATKLATLVNLAEFMVNSVNRERCWTEEVSKASSIKPSDSFVKEEREAKTRSPSSLSTSSTTSTPHSPSSAIKEERDTGKVTSMNRFLFDEPYQIQQDFGEKCDSERILCLYKVCEVSEEVELIFLHTEGMALLLGVGVPFGTVLINPESGNIRIKQGPKTSWREFLKQSFCPVVFERQKCFARTAIPSGSYLSAKDAASKLGVGMEGSSHFVKQTSRKSSRVVEVEWINQLHQLIKKQQLLGHASHQDGAGSEVCAKNTGQSKSGMDSGVKTEGASSVHIEQSTGGMGSMPSRGQTISETHGTFQGPEARHQEEKSEAKVEADKFLTVVVILNEDSCKFDPPTEHLCKFDPSTDDLQDKCFIKPTLTISFCSHDEVAEETSDPDVHVEFDVEYQLQENTDNVKEFGWYHEKLSFSFGCAEKNCAHLYHKEVRNQKSIDMEEINVQQKSTSSSVVVGADLGIFGGQNFWQGGGRLSTSGGPTYGSNISEQVSKKYSVNVLAADSQFTITDQTLRSKIKYEAALRSAFKPSHPPEKMWDEGFRSEKKGTGMFSTLGINVLGKWILRTARSSSPPGEPRATLCQSSGDHRFRKHEFAAEKTLSKHKRQSCESNAESPDSSSHGTLTVVQKINATFVFNHQFSSRDVDAKKRTSVYRWFLNDGTERRESPVGEFLKDLPIGQTSPPPTSPTREASEQTVVLMEP